MSPTAELKVGKEAQALAEANGIDLSTVTATGIGGMITKPDVQAAIDAGTGSGGTGGGAAGAAPKKSAPKYAAADDVNAEIANGTEPVALALDAAFYCPGCGKRFDTAGECVGGEFGHEPIAVVSTAELAGDPADFTAAPNTD